MSNNCENLNLNINSDSGQLLITPKSYEDISNSNNKLKNIFVVPFNKIIFFIIIIILIIFIFFSLGYIAKYSSTTIFIIGFFISIIIIFLTLGLSKKEIKLIKFEFKNKLEIRLINYLCFSIKKIEVILENIHFDCKKIVKNEETPNLKLYIFIDYKNSKEIDLDSNINLLKINLPKYIIFLMILNMAIMMILD